MSGPARVSERTSGATLTAEALVDLSFDARAAVPEADAILTGLAERAERARSTLDHVLGVAYAEHADTWLDIYRPAGPGPHPVFVYFRGTLDAREAAYMALAMANAGIVTVCVNHGLPPPTPLATVVEQCRRAVAWIGAEIARYGGDPERLALCGHSRGAHLAAMACAADGGVPLAPRVVLLISGLFDLAPVQASDAGAWLDLDPASLDALSPVRHPLAPATQVVLTCGEYESEAFKRQTDGFFRVCAEVGCQTRFVSAPGRNHFDAVLDLTDPSVPLFQTLARTLGTLT